MDGSGGPRPAPPMRAADSDRAATVHVLQDAVARGLLTPDEGSDRMAAAWAAVHLRDLAPLTADLPAAPAPAPLPARTGAPGWRPLGLMAWEQVRTTVRRAPGRPGIRLALAAVLAVLLLVALGSSLLEAVFDGGPGGWGEEWDGPRSDRWGELDPD